jgi:hypothetical protein
VHPQKDDTQEERRAVKQDPVSELTKAIETTAAGEETGTTEATNMNEHYKAKARKHWMAWLPEKVATFRAAGELEAALQMAANQTRAEVDN